MTVALPIRPIRSSIVIVAALALVASRPVRAQSSASDARSPSGVSTPRAPVATAPAPGDLPERIRRAAAQPSAPAAITGAAGTRSAWHEIADILRARRSPPHPSAAAMSPALLDACLVAADQFVRVSDVDRATALNAFVRDTTQRRDSRSARDVWVRATLQLEELHSRLRDDASASQLLDQAERAAVTPEQIVAVRLARAMHEVRIGESARAVATLLSIDRDPRLATAASRVASQRTSLRVAATGAFTLHAELHEVARSERSAPPTAAMRRAIELLAQVRSQLSFSLPHPPPYRPGQRYEPATREPDEPAARRVVVRMTALARGIDEGFALYHSTNRIVQRARELRERCLEVNAMRAEVGRLRAPAAHLDAARAAWYAWREFYEGLRNARRWRGHAGHSPRAVGWMREAEDMLRRAHWLERVSIGLVTPSLATRVFLLRTRAVEPRARETPLHPLEAQLDEWLAEARAEAMRALVDWMERTLTQPGTADVYNEFAERLAAMY